MRRQQSSSSIVLMWRLYFTTNAMFCSVRQVVFGLQLRRFSSQTLKSRPSYSELLAKVAHSIAMSPPDSSSSYFAHSPTKWVIKSVTFSSLTRPPTALAKSRLFNWAINQSCALSRPWDSNLFTCLFSALNPLTSIFCTRAHPDVVVQSG